MSSKRSEQGGFVEVTLGAGTLSPTFERLPIAEAYGDDKLLKPDHELIRLAQAQLEIRLPSLFRRDRWHTNMQSLARSLPATPVIKSSLPNHQFVED